MGEHLTTNQTADDKLTADKENRNNSFTAKLVLLAAGGMLLALLLTLAVMLTNKYVTEQPSQKTTVAADYEQEIRQVLPTPAPKISTTIESTVQSITTIEPTELAVATPTPHPLEGLGTKGTDGWYLQLRDRYPIVADIQKRLYELGYMEIPAFDGNEGFTTAYGPSTKVAVKAFQAVNGLDCDGLLSESSYDLLMSDNAKELQFSNSSSNSVFEDYIIKLQARLISLHYLSGEATGEFETKTQNALKQFQTKNGLTADGIAGPLTLQILYSTDALDATSSVTATAIPNVTE